MRMSNIIKTKFLTFLISDQKGEQSVQFQRVLIN